MSTTPTETANDNASELRRVATNIETYRADLGTPKAQLLRAHPDLGSDKTYNKIVAGDLAQLDIESWLEKYQRAWNAIQHDEQSADAGLIESLSAPVELCRAYLEYRNTRGNDRFLPVLGDSGLGKTSAVAVLRAKPYGGNIYELEACDVWKDKHGRGTAAPLLIAIAERLGMTDLPGGKSKLLKLVLNKLRERRICLAIEEAHHLCPQGINTLKALINLTPTFIIVTAIPLLWERLAGSKAAWAECKQLTGNRLAEKIVLTLNRGDVELCIADCARDRVKAAALDDLVKKTTDKLLSEAVSRGNLKFVSKVCASFAREVGKGQDADLGTFTNVIASEKKKR